MGSAKIFGCVTAGLLAVLTARGADEAWPEAPREAKPWIRLPAAADTAGLLPYLAKTGFGGVVLLPPTSIDDPDWLEPATEAANEAIRQEIEFDLALDAGPLPATTREELRARELEPFDAIFQGGGVVDLDMPKGEIDTLGAWPPNGRPLDLTDAVGEDGLLHWQAPAGEWRLFGLFHRPAGNEPDPFSPVATNAWLDPLARSMADGLLPFPRAIVFEQSARTNGGWTTDFHAGFQRLRGYDLREELPALFGDSDPGTSDRVVGDFRQTMGDLHLESIATIHQFARDRMALSRTTLRGNPGNPIDLQAVADIPGILSPDDPPFAASAAHFALKPLVSGVVRLPSDATPDELRARCRGLWLRGANQLVLEPVPESIYPGLPALAGWITRTQSILQSGAPDPDLLLYLPYHDFLASRGGLPDDPDARLAWLEASGFGHAMRAFENAGIAYDIVSDRLLDSAVVADGSIILGGLTYRGLVLPEVLRLPETTAVVLRDLSRRGAKIGVMGEWPTDIPGFPSPDIRRGTLVQALNAVSNPIEEDDPILLAEAMGVTGEALAGTGLRAIRRHHAEGHHYWIVNPTDHPIDATFPLSRPAHTAVALDPAIPGRAGVIAVRPTDDSPLELHLRLDPGETRLIRTFREPIADTTPWHESGGTLPLTGTWSLHFGDITLDTPLLGSWRTMADPAFASADGPIGYSLEFELTNGHDGAWLLDLGKVADVAEVSLDGQPLGSVFGSPAVLAVPPLAPGKHRLEVVVSALPGDGAAGLLGPVRLREF